MNNVTIVIASYNQSEYLKEAIESAIAQTHPCEVIVVDDGSTDDSLRIAKSFEPKVKVISQVNKGLASTRNTGIMNATGDWILPLDADDILDVECVAELLFKADGTDYDVIGPSMRTFGLHHETTIVMEDPKLEDFRIGNRLGYFSMIKKSALLEIGGYSPRMVHGYEDLHLWINLLTRGKKIGTTKQPLVYYRTKSSSMYTEAKKHHKELMEQIYKDFPAFLPV